MLQYPQCYLCTTEPFEELEVYNNRGKKLTLTYCPIGNSPKNPIIAVVGFSPGPQQVKTYKKLVDQGTHPVEALSKAAFSGRLRKNLAEMLQALYLPQILGFNNSEQIFQPESLEEKIHLTSLVKCPAKIDNKPKPFDPRYFPQTLICATIRFKRELPENSVKLFITLGKHVEEFFQSFYYNYPYIAIPHPSPANMRTIKSFLNDQQKLEKLRQQIEKYLS